MVPNVVAAVAAAVGAASIWVVAVTVVEAAIEAAVPAAPAPNTVTPTDATLYSPSLSGPLTPDITSRMMIKVMKIDMIDTFTDGIAGCNPEIR